MRTWFFASNTGVVVLAEVLCISSHKRLQIKINFIWKTYLESSMTSTKCAALPAGAEKLSIGLLSRFDGSYTSQHWGGIGHARYARASMQRRYSKSTTFNSSDSSVQPKDLIYVMSYVVLAYYLPKPLLLWFWAQYLVCEAGQSYGSTSHTKNKLLGYTLTTCLEKIR